MKVVKQASGYDRNPHQREAGNGHVAVLKHVFNASDADGDVFKLGRFGFDMHYYRITVACATGAGAGVTVDLGIHTLTGEEGDTETPDFFKAGIDVSAAGRQVLDCATFDMRDGAKGGLHDVVMTLHGDPADGACIEVIMEYIYNGR